MKLISVWILQQNNIISTGTAAVAAGAAPTSVETGAAQVYVASLAANTALGATVSCSWVTA